MIDFYQVSKDYGSLAALKPIDLHIDSGERVALIGPSGSGKTTLINLLSGFIEPSFGNLLIDGNSVANLKKTKQISRVLGVIQQQFDLVSHLSVIHNVNAGRLGEWGFFKSLLSLINPIGKSEVVDALESVGIEPKLYQRTSTLSGGEQQRVAVARVLIQDPQIVLADEPVASLDPYRSEELIKLLVDLTIKRDKTFIASLHKLELVREYFTRVIGLREGHVTFDVPVSKLNEKMIAQLYSLDAS
mgnify:FL=1|tara:strand:+ start:155 stop:889 length:735 start_codon:yes stop_codon:yes gene_type:complete